MFLECCRYLHLADGAYYLQVLDIRHLRAVTTAPTLLSIKFSRRVLILRVLGVNCFQSFFKKKNPLIFLETSCPSLD